MSRTVAARRQVREQPAARALALGDEPLRRPPRSRAPSPRRCRCGRPRRSSRGSAPHSAGALAPTPRGSHDTMSNRSSTERSNDVVGLAARARCPSRRDRPGFASSTPIRSPAGRAPGEAELDRARRRDATSRAAPTSVVHSIAPQWCQTSEPVRSAIGRRRRTSTTQRRRRGPRPRARATTTRPLVAPRRPDDGDAGSRPPGVSPATRAPGAATGSCPYACRLCSA